MTRPLLYKTGSELHAMIARNRENAAELELILAELRHRKTLNARNLEIQVKAHLNEITVDRIGTEPDSSPQGNPELPLRDLSSNPTAPGNSPSTRQEDMNQQRQWTEEAVADLRRKLIDLSKRNPLIAFKHSSRGASHLRIVDERPDLIHAAISEDGLGFEPLPDEEVTPADELTPSFHIANERARLTDPEFLAATAELGEEESDVRAWQTAERVLRARLREQSGLPKIEYGKALDLKALALAHGFNLSYDLGNSDDDDVQAHHDDDHMRVLMTRKELDKRLKTIWDRYRGHARETGLHTLFLVLGFIEWFEDDESGVALHAPLLLLSVGLEQKVKYGRYEYTLRAHEDGLQVNVALGEKLRRDFGIELPGLREDETPESYFVRIEQVLANVRRLSLRRFATLTVLPFPRMVLWKDLDPAQWPDGAFAAHPLLPSLLRAAGTDGAASMGETHDIDVSPWSERAPPLIQPADASQHSALIDVAEGKSLAIEGPPGTGKSQTITNMIAAALGAGKRVLFVAEKQAALNVVANRLRHAGLGTMLLELHSDSSNRADIYESLRQRLAARDRVDWDERKQMRADLSRQREMLRRYLALISTPLGKQARTAHWLAWREIRLRADLTPLSVKAIAERWQPKDAEAIDRSEIASNRSLLDTFSAALAAVDTISDADGRTNWVHATKLDPFDQAAQRAAARRASEAASVLHRCIEDVSPIIALRLPGPDEDPTPVLAQLASLESFGDIDEPVARAALRARDAARALLARQMRWRQLRTRLNEDVIDATLASPASVQVLSNALSAHDALPSQVADCGTHLAAIRELGRALADASDARNELTSRLNLSARTPIAILREVAASIAGLDDAHAPVTALYSPRLLEKVAAPLLVQERGDASAIATERTAIEGSVIAEAFDREPNELDSLAASLSDSGLFARLFSGGYSAAKRESTRLLADQPKRLLAAELLRQLARVIRRESNFRRESGAAGYFPAELWRGVRSDWDSLQAAAEELANSRDQLTSTGCENVIGAWLSLPDNVRSQIAGISRRLHGLFENAAALGYDATPADEIVTTVSRDDETLAQVTHALEQVGARPEGIIIREGETLAERLASLQAMTAEFSAIADDEAFDWVIDIEQPLEVLARALEQADRIRAASGPLAITGEVEESATPVAQVEMLIAWRGRYHQAVNSWAEALQELQALTGLSLDRLVNPGAGWAAVSNALEVMSGDEAGAKLAANLLRYRTALDEIGLGPLADAALAGEVPHEHLADHWELAITRTLIMGYLGGTGQELGRIGGLTLEAARKAFVRIDIALHEVEAKAILAKRLADVPPKGIDFGPRGHWTELSLLEHELGLKRPRSPIRDVTARAGATLQVLKPVWMMSPTSAAQYIRPGSLDFDLLIVDEASQMRPEFAASAIMRGKQFVVVGDANQLPPTDFFGVNSSDDEEDEEGEDGKKSETMKVGTESILDLANERFRDRRRLKWHYRSQHEGLIQFSNREFYGRDLVVFPSPTTDDDLLGVKHVYVGGTYEASINQAEAEAVIEEAFRLMRTYPQHSIGIATMNAKQTELIRNEFDRLILEAPEVRRYVDEYAGGIEEFFIKNLENVQGDERDIVLISTVYGPDKSGNVMQRFGPINRDIGWRRLNVLVTRSKLSTRIFTSLRPDDIKITPSSSRGLLALRAYLTYARDGAQFDDDTGGEPDSDFEVFVADAIRAAGFKVIHQVGVEGFRIDLGVKHDDYPIGFIAGIECDGASYHQGLTVRDRDRIRQSVLEGMGWRIYRVWSTDWFADPARETAKLLEHLDQWRDEAAADYALRPRTDDTCDAPPPDDEPAEAVISLTQSATDYEPQTFESEDSGTEIQAQQTGRAMRPLDGIEWYEVSRGRLYEVWHEDKLAGRVEVLSRALAPPRVYGGQVSVARSVYEGWIAMTGDRFTSHDIHAAVREVARRALSSDSKSV